MAVTIHTVLLIAVGCLACFTKAQQFPRYVQCPRDDIATTCNFVPGFNCLSDDECGLGECCCPRGCGKVCKPQSVLVEVPPRPVGSCPFGEPTQDVAVSPCSRNADCDAESECRGINCCIARTCQNTPCVAGQICSMQEVVCVTGPCHPMPFCLPNPCLTSQCPNECKLKICEPGSGSSCRPQAICPVGTCPSGQPYMQNGVQWYCGLGGRPCPSGYECFTHPTDRFAVCCRKDIVGTCPSGQPYTQNGVQWYCGRGGRPCPSGYQCVIDPADRFAVCCRKDIVGTCPFGVPYSIGGLQLKCGDQGQSCPSGWTCRYNTANPFGVCCPLPPEPVCEFGPPLTEGGVQIHCGIGPYSRPCPKGSSCISDPLDAFAVCCPEKVPKPRPKPNVVIIVCVVVTCVVVIIVILVLCFCCPGYCGDPCYTPRRRRRKPKVETRVTHVFPQPACAPPAPVNFGNSVGPACNCHMAPVAPPCTCQVQNLPSCNCNVMARPSCKYCH